MVNHHKKGLFLFLCSVFLFFLSSVSVFTVCFLSSTMKNLPKTVLYIGGIVFWAGILSAVLINCFLTVSRIKYEKKSKAVKDRQLFVPFVFFSSLPAIIIDALFIICIAGFTVSFFIKENNQTISLALLLSSLFFTEMHILFNSRNFKTIFQESRRNEA